MAQKFDVTVLKQKVVHDGLSMLVLKPTQDLREGESNPPLPGHLIADLVGTGAIEAPDDWEPLVPREVVDLPSSDGAVFSAPPPASEPITTDMVRGAPDAALSPDLLENKSLISLIEIAAAEGIIPDLEEMRLSLVETIRAKRAGLDWSGLAQVDDESEQPDPPLNVSEGDGIIRDAIPAERQADGSFAGTAELTGEGDAPAAGDLSQLDHDRDGNPGGSLPREPVSLTGKNKTELRQIADDEGVEIADDATNKDIVAAIEAKRADAAGGDEVGEGDAPA